MVAEVRSISPWLCDIWSQRRRGRILFPLIWAHLVLSISPWSSYISSTESFRWWSQFLLWFHWISRWQSWYLMFSKIITIWCKDDQHEIRLWYFDEWILPNELFNSEHQLYEKILLSSWKITKNQTVNETTKVLLCGKEYQK